MIKPRKEARSLGVYHLATSVSVAGYAAPCTMPSNVRQETSSASLPATMGVAHVKAQPVAMEAASTAFPPTLRASTALIVCVRM
jgi:hypothetical protein